MAGIRATKGSKAHHARIYRLAWEEGKSPLEFLLDVMRDENQPFPFRFEAAKSAAPYVHPRLQSTELTGDPDKPVNIVQTKPLTAEQWAEQHREDD